jgi:penicillin-binding protein 1A
LLSQVLEGENNYGRLKPALVLTVSDEAPEKTEEETEAEIQIDKGKGEEYGGYATFMLKAGDRAVLPWNGMSWARPYRSLNKVGDPPKLATEILQPGDVIWVYESENDIWALGQAPQVQGAFVAMAPNDGAIRGLIGGFNFQRSNFNRATQAKRQAGSSFKPVIYSAALSKSFTPASLINDAPVVFEDEALEGTWRPENYSGTFHGPTRLREALYKSRNLVSIRVLRSVGVRYATRFASKFGFDEKELPHDLSLALGSCEVSPVQMARAFSVFANGGYLIQPYLIKRIEDVDGAILYKADSEVACVSCELASRSSSRSDPNHSATNRTTNQSSDDDQDEETIVVLPKQAPQTLEPRLTYQMNSILQDVVLRGTGRRALTLGRRDLAGKTGTTNDQKDAWFNGYHPDLVASVWVGFDQVRSLGDKEAGSRAALPIWIDFMRVALEGVPEKQMQRPEGLVTLKINAKTGEVANDRDKTAVFEIFRSENAPVPGQTRPTAILDDVDSDNPIPEQLF